MKHLYFYILLLLSSASYSSTLECHKIIGRSQKHQDRIKAIPDFKASSLIDDKAYLVFKRRSEGGLTIETTRPNYTLFGGPTLNNLSPKAYATFKATKLIPLDEQISLEPSVKSYLKTADMELSKFLKKHYPRREWNDEFVDQISNPSRLHDFIFSSRRTVVYNSEGEIVGSAAAIYSPYLVISGGDFKTPVTIPWMSGEKLLAHLKMNSFKGGDFEAWRLPVENFFNISLPRSQTGRSIEIILDGKEYIVSSGFLIEMGSYAINQNSPLRDKITEELYFEFLLMMYESAFKLHYSDKNSRIIDQLFLKNNQPLFFSYGDLIGQRLYRPFGFQNLKNVTAEGYNVKWSPLFAGPNMVRRFGASKKLEHVAKRIFRLLEDNFIGPDGSHTFFQSEAQDMAQIYRASEIKRTFFEIEEPQIRELFFMNDSPPPSHRE